MKLPLEIDSYNRQLRAAFEASHCNLNCVILLSAINNHDDGYQKKTNEMNRSLQS